MISGLGHTGSQPFDDQQGWYRAYRGLAGGLRYKANLKGWSPFLHSIFPTPLKQGVVTMLMCQHEEIGEKDRSNTNAVNAVVVPIKRITPHIIYHICEFMHWDWFIDCDAAAAKKRENNSFAESIARRLGVEAHNNGTAMHYILNYIQNQTAGSDDDDDDEDYDDGDEDVYEDDDYYNHAVAADEDYDNDDEYNLEANDDEDDDDDDDEEYHDTIDPVDHIHFDYNVVEDQGFNTSDDDDDDDTPGTPESSYST